jgi:hypothetical protein
MATIRSRTDVMRKTTQHEKRETLASSKRCADMAMVGHVAPPLAPIFGFFAYDFRSCHVSFGNTSRAALLRGAPTQIRRIVTALGFVASAAAQRATRSLAPHFSGAVA